MFEEPSHPEDRWFPLPVWIDLTPAEVVQLVAAVQGQMEIIFARRIDIWNPVKVTGSLAQSGEESFGDLTAVRAMGGRVGVRRREGA